MKNLTQKIKDNFVFYSIIFVIIAGFIGFIVVDKNSPNGGNNKPVDIVSQEEKDAGINRSTVDEVKTKIAAGGTYTFIVGSDTCGACIMYKENLKELASEEKIKLDYVDLMTASEDEVLNLFKEIDFDISEGFSTPTTIIVEDGKLKDTVVGAVDVKTLLEEHGEDLNKMKNAAE